MADLRTELLCEIGPKTHISDICQRALQEINLKSARVAVLEQEIERLRIMAFKHKSEHVNGCRCIQCVPF